MTTASGGPPVDSGPVRRFRDPGYQPLTSSLARRHNRGFEPLPEVVEAAYRALVAAFIAGEQQYFGQTETIEENPCTS